MTHKETKTRFDALVATLAIGAALAFGASGCGTDAKAATAAKPRDLSVPVRTITAQASDATRAVVGVGRVAHQSDHRLGFKIGGVIARIEVDEGDPVKKGQVLARLDPREIDAAVTQADSALAKAERDLARAKELSADRIVPVETLENATTARDVARASSQAARFNRDTAVVRAPADGVVIARLAEPGEVVGPGMPLLLIGARQAGLVARVGVPDREAARLALGDPAEVALDGAPAKVTAHVVRIAPTVTPRTGLVEVELALDAPPPTTIVGAMARATITPRATTRVVKLPLGALIDGQGRSAAVWVLAASGVEVARRELTVAWVDEREVAIATGLTAGELVITDGAPYLDATSRVRVVAPAPAVAAAVRP